MDQSIENVVLGIIANGLTAAIAHVGGKLFTSEEILERIKREKTALQPILDRAAEAVSAGVEWNGPSRIEEVCLFLLSDEAAAIVRQIFSSKVSDGDGGQGLQRIREEFLSSLSRSLVVEEEVLADSAKTLLDALIEACEQALDIAIDDEVLSAHEAKSSVRYRLLRDEIAAIRKNLEALVAQRNQPALNVPQIPQITWHTRQEDIPRPHAVNLLHVTDLGKGQVQVSWQHGNNIPRHCIPVSFADPLTAEDRRELRWYLEDYLQFPYGAERWRAEQVEEKMAGWGESLFRQVFPKLESDPDPRSFYQEAVREGLEKCELCITSEDPVFLSVPWELIHDPIPGRGFLAMSLAGLYRQRANQKVEASEERVPDRPFGILLVIARPYGDKDVSFGTVARPILAALRQLRPRVELEVLRPPTFDALVKRLNARRAAATIWSTSMATAYSPEPPLAPPWPCSAGRPIGGISSSRRTMALRTS